MKLYTEEQVEEAIILCIYKDPLTPFTDIIAKLKAIELPTDKEIEIHLGLLGVNDSVINGAKWMRDKIQGGNQ